MYKYEEEYVEEIQQEVEVHFDLETYLLPNDFEAIEEKVVEILSPVIFFGTNYWYREDATRALLLLEAANWAAKVCSESFYNLKDKLAEIILEEFKDSVLSWSQNGVIYFYREEVGTVSCHFPYGFEDMETKVRHPNLYVFDWSGIRRQSFAFEIIESENVLKAFAYGTRPRSLYDTGVYTKFYEMLKEAGIYDEAA